MIDTVRGVIRVRRWPKKRGKPKSELHKYWVDWFRQANFLAKYADAASHIRAIELTAHTGLYPRDIILSAMRGRLYSWADSSGWKWFPMAAIQDISDSLDVLAQTVGSVLVRAVDRWRAAGPAVPSIGDALTYQGASLPPVWAAAGAGVSQQALPGTPIVPDGTVNSYEIDVSSFADFEITLDAVGMVGAASVELRFSLDGGATFQAGAADYWYSIFNHMAAAQGTADAIGLSGGAAATGHKGTIRFTNLKAARAVMMGMTYLTTAAYFWRSGGLNLNGPITNIKIYTTDTSNFNAGTLRLAGLLAA